MTIEFGTPPESPSPTLSDGVLSIQGTAGADLIEFPAAGSAESDEHQVSVNGRSYSFDADEVDRIVLTPCPAGEVCDAGRGDKVVVHLSGSPHDAEVLPRHATVAADADGYTMQILDADTIDVFGSEEQHGNRATIRGQAGPDQLEWHPRRVWLSGDATPTDWWVLPPLTLTAKEATIRRVSTAPPMTSRRSSTQATRRSPLLSPLFMRLASSEDVTLLLPRIFLQ